MDLIGITPTRILRCLAGAGIGALLSVTAVAADYHIDSRTGDDRASGLSPALAWRSLAPANTHDFSAGDRILLRAGGEWRGVALRPRGSGTAAAPLVIDRYGDGSDPALHGDGKVEAVVGLNNQEYWDIGHLEITNHSTGDKRPSLRGVEIRGHDAGWLHGIRLHDLQVHDINGPPANFPDEQVFRKNFGGIIVLIDGTAKPTAWDGLLVEKCHVHDVSATGIATASTWVQGHRDNNPATWLPSRNVVIRGNLIERTARDGVIVRASVGPRVEHNRFLYCAIEANGVGCFAFHCDDAVFQFNEAAYTKYNPGDVDASGFDSDWNCRRTIIQYNYSHDNEYGFVLLCCDGKTGFNEDTVVRYNISQNDGGNSIRISGGVKRAAIHNNTIYVAPDMANPREGDPPRVVFHKSWNGWSQDVEFTNNIFINRSERTVYEPGASTGNRYLNNLFFGFHPASEPPDAKKMTVDPLLANAGGATSRESAATAYRPTERSPVRDGGATPTGTRGTDFAGNALVTHDGRTDLGALVAPR